MLILIRRYSFLLMCFVMGALASEVQASTTSGFDTLNSTTMPFAIEGNEIMNLSVNGLNFDPGKAITGLTYLNLTGPLTINEGWNPDQGIAINSNQIWKNVTTGDSNLYIQWDGNGTRFGGKIATNGLDPNDIPGGWGGGIRTWDIYAGGSIAVGPGGGQTSVVINNGGIAILNGNIWAHNTIIAQSPSGSWGGVFQGPEYGVYASGGDWAGYFDGPVHVNSVQYPDGSTQTTANQVPSGTWCGVATNYVVVPCQGLAAGCPAGWTWFWVSQAASTWVGTCMKN